jgi:hypothetical protein
MRHCNNAEFDGGGDPVATRMKISANRISKNFLSI